MVGAIVFGTRRVKCGLVVEMKYYDAALLEAVWIVVQRKMKVCLSMHGSNAT